MPQLPPIKNVESSLLLMKQLEEWRQKLERTPTVFTGEGTPEGMKVANRGDIYINTVGSAGRFAYIKTTDTGPNGWELLNSTTLEQDADTTAISGASSVTVEDNTGTTAALVSDTATYTVMQRCRINNATADARFFYSGTTGDVAGHCRIVSSSGDYQYFVVSTASYERYVAFVPNLVAIGDWFVIAYRWNSGVLATFLNGTQIVTSHVGAAFPTLSAGDPTDTLQAARSGPIAVSEFAIWDTALTDAQIASMGGPILDIGAIESLAPLSWIRCGDNSGDSAAIFVDVGSTGAGAASWAGSGGALVSSV